MIRKILYLGDNLIADTSETVYSICVKIDCHESEVILAPKIK